MKQHELRSPKGAHHRSQRVGRGNGSGRGTYSGRGLKGQKSRSGFGLIPGFEGGQLRLIKGLTMTRGFNNKFKTYYSLIKLEDLDQFAAGERITPESLLARGLLRNQRNPIKILGNGEVSKSLTVAAHKFTQSAREKIEAAGGMVEEL